MAANARVLTFRAGARRLSLAIGDVREVTRMPRVTRVPNAPVALLGLANLRGTVIPVFSAATLLDSGRTVPGRLVVIEYGEQGHSEWLGLAVDEASQALATDLTDTVTALEVALLARRTMPETVPRRLAGTGASDTGAVPLRELAGAVASTGLVVFALGNQEFALGVDAVESILLLPADIALMPDADAAVIGSTTHDGATLPLLCLRALLALPAGAGPHRPRVLVARIGAERIGLQVDAVREILAIPDAQIDPLPLALRRGAGEARIQAICRLDDGARLISVLAADQLLNTEQTARMLARAVPEGESMTEGDDATAAGDAEVGATEQMLVFRIGTDEFGIAVSAIEEIAALPATLTRLPKVPAFVEGVMNLRGAVVPVINIGLRLGAQALADARRRVIVLRIGEVQAAFVVDAIVDVLRIDAAALRPTPDLGNDETRIFERVANLTDAQRIILVISPRELLDRAEQDLLLGLGKKGSKAGP